MKEKLLFDTHLHTCFSPDSAMTINQARAAAEQLGIGLIITEHMDLNMPSSIKFCFDIDEYLNSYQPLRDDKLLIGIELGMQPNLTTENEKIAAADFDFVLGSVHMAGQNDLTWSTFYKGRSKKDSYSEYLKTMAECIRTHQFIDSLAHIDYVARVSNYPDPELYYNEFPFEFDQIFEALIATDTALEINTKRLTEEVAENLLHLYRRFAEMGGKGVTIGSDAHAPMRVGAAMSRAVKLAADAGLSIFSFNKRQAVKIY